MLFFKDSIVRKIIKLLAAAMMFFAVIPDLYATYKEGSIIEFGNYPFEADGTKKPIEWIVLKNYGNGNGLIISKYALNAVKYNNANENIFWENSTIRKWLNGSFYNAAFDNQEKRLIQIDYVANERNPHYKTDAGSSTYDKVYLLSIEEAQSFFANDKARKAYPTPFAKTQQTKTKKPVYTDAVNGDSCWWWLRSPGNLSNSAAHVNSVGFVYSCGIAVDNNDYGIRPVLMINLKYLKDYERRKKAAAAAQAKREKEEQSKAEASKEKPVPEADGVNIIKETNVVKEKERFSNEQKEEKINVITERGISLNVFPVIKNQPAPVRNTESYESESKKENAAK